MPVTNSIPDSDRYVSYEPVVETTNFPVGFVLFTGDAEEAKSEIEVKIDGQVLDEADYSLQGTFDFTTDYPVCIDAEVVLPDGVADVTLEIEGKKPVERVQQLPEGQGVAPRYWNVILNRIWAILRENRQRLDRVPTMPYGEAPPTPAEMLAWRDYVLAPGEVISVQGRTGPVVITAADVGLGNAPNYPIASQAEAEAGGATDKLMNPLRTKQAIDALAPSVVLPTGYLFGLTLSNNASDATNDIDIAVGKARDGADAADLVLAGALTKRLDAAWVVGTNQGGLDTGVKGAVAWYHLWLIRRTDTGVVDVLFSGSATAPTMPTNYTQKRRIGAVLTDGSGAIRAFTQHGDHFGWTSPVTDVNVSTMGTSAVSRALSVPPSSLARIEAIFTNSNASPQGYGLISSLSETDVAASSSANTSGQLGNAAGALPLSSQTLEVRTNDSSQIRSRFSISNAQTGLLIRTLGWTDDRGRSAA